MEDFIAEEEDEDDAPKKGRGAKKGGSRSASQASAKSPGKKKGSKAKKDNGLDQFDLKFLDYVKNGKIKSLKNDELKEFLAAKNLPNRGNKNFMVELIEEYFANLNLLD